MERRPFIQQQRDSKEKVRVSIYLPLELKEKLLEVSRRRNKSMALTVRELLEKGLREVSS
ncbi:hypothetical protein DRP07_11915 [Archaeoglobales archaeon]|nr:MAG: hypothetical protein DRG83_01235 [Deltaproteobacteria bacterium]RLG49887.1 MAG: hypothetical protein DRN90_00615 [Candidatus Korarchaeota archaeon]RLI77726.1 MAG: hypothetical protein DRP07_11915 [Archaeoglobales archaeon]